MFKYKILVIEDDQVINELIRSTLHCDRYETYAAHEFSEAIGVMSENWPDLILLDFSFDTGNALEFINNIEERFNNMPPFVVITAIGDEKTATSVLKRGAIDYVVKDNDFLSELPDIIVHAFKDIEVRNKLVNALDKLNESETKYRLIFENSNIGIARIRYKDWCVVDCNNCFAKLMGYLSREDLIESILMNTSFTYKEAAHNGFFSFFTHEIMENQEVKIELEGNKSIYILLSANAYWDQGFIDYMAVDITRQKEAEMEMEYAKNRAENADREKSEFITRVNHEIRTPLSTVIGFSELLTTKITDEKYRKYLDAISSAGKHLLLLINDMLDFSKLEAGMMKIRNEKIDFKNLINGVVQNFEHDIIERGLELRIKMGEDLPKYIFSDDVRLRQVFTNLISNAVKFTEKGSISFVANIVKESCKGNTADFVFEIQDTGIGIPQDEIDSIFKPFIQKRGQDETKYGGTGLGLPISGKIISLMNGNIKVESEVAVGSNFIVRLSGLKFEN